MNIHSDFIKTKVGVLVGSWDRDTTRKLASAVRGTRLNDAVDKQFADGLMVMGFNSVWDLVTLLAYAKLTKVCE